jgi:hypothetical protein
MAIRDVTAEVRFGAVDDGFLPMTRCLCGMEWVAWGGPILSTDPRHLYECPECHAKFHFSNTIKVWVDVTSSPQLWCRACEGTGNGTIHGVPGVCNACDGSGIDTSEEPCYSPADGTDGGYDDAG